jgi:hypothetical protein
MWYRVTWAARDYREEEYQELVFSYEDKLLDNLASKLDVSNKELVVLEIEKYDIKEGIC